MIRFGHVSVLIAPVRAMREPELIGMPTDRSVVMVELADAGRRSILCEARRG